MAKSKPDLNVPNASPVIATRNKVVLKPGRSLMDWIRFTHSGKDLTETGGKCLEISPRELAKHNTKSDAWIALQGKVYNITHYLEYHPGGEDELMRGAGKDGTDLFNKVHRWVNAESMLQKCFIGFLKKSWSLEFSAMNYLKAKQKKVPAPLYEPLKSEDDKKSLPKDSNTKFRNSVTISKSFSNDQLTLPINKSDNLVQHDTDKLDWPTSTCNESDNSINVKVDENSESVKLVLESSDLSNVGLITDLVKNELFVKTNSSSQIVKFSFPVLFESEYDIIIQSGVSLELSFIKIMKQNDLTSPSMCVQNALQLSSCKLTDLLYWLCKFIKKSAVTHNTFLFTFCFPSGTKMLVPIGQHIYFKSFVEEMEIIRSYTPILPLKVCDKVDTSKEIDGSEVQFLIKTYSSGIMSNKINQLNIGDHMWISSYLGSFSESLLKNCKFAVLLAAGTGITPMLKIINWLLEKDRGVQLIFFNKTEVDIIWKNELEECSATHENFSVIHVLSEPCGDWSGFSGPLNVELFNKIVVSKEDRKFFICGPLLFSEAAEKCLEEVGYNSEDFYIFDGS